MTEFVDRAFSSIVLVIPSRDAEAIAATNHLSLCEMINPFGQFHINKAQYPNPFSLRFLYLRDIVRATVKEAQDSTHEAVAAFDVALPTEEAQASGYLEPGLTPWFDAYCREFLGLVRSSDHEFFNHPLACLSVVSTSHPDPLTFLEQSYSAENPPRPFSAQGLEPNIYRYFLVLHDGSDGDETQADAILATMKARFGEGNCSKLIVNTFVGEKDANDGMADLWKNHVPPTKADAAAAAAAAPQSPTSPAAEADKDGEAMVAGADAAVDPLQAAASKKDAASASKRVVYGRKLAPADLKRVQGFVNAFGTNSLVPYLEGVASNLEAHIAHSKKSAYSSAKKWLGLGSSSAAKSAAEAQDQSGLSNLSTRMAQRRLGDIAFTLQKYETAINTYHTVKKEFSHDKAWKDYAGAQEMEGVCVYQQDNTRADNRYFDAAIGGYERCKASLYLCRATLIAANIALTRNKYKEAAMVFMRSANEESDLRSALLLEQVANCHLKMSPSCQKRAAFHMVLAGHRFVKAGLRQNALRCYIQARQVYSSKQWNLAEDHINFTVGRQAYCVGNATDALEAFSVLIGDSNQQVAQQKLYMKEFLQAWKAVHGTNSDGTEELPLPLILDESITLSMNTTDKKTSDPQWSQLEISLLGQARDKRKRVSSMSRFTRLTELSRSPVCVAGEPFFLEMKIRNPLRVPIELRGVKMLGHVVDEEAVGPQTKKATWLDASSTPVARDLGLLPPTDAAAADAPGAADTADAENDAAAAALKPGTYQSELVRTPIQTLGELVVKIPPRQSTLIKLSATSSVTGQVTLEGIQFSFAGAIHGSRRFKGKGRRLNATRAQQRNVIPHYGPDYRLRPIVIPPMPLLEGNIAGLGPTLVSGQVVDGALKLVNSSKATLFRLFIGCSRGDCVLFHEDAFKGTFKFLENSRVSVLTLDLPDGLAAGSEITIPFSCQVTTRKVHNLEVMFMVYYEAEKPHARLPYRMLKLIVAMTVSPSLIIQSSVHKAPDSLDQRLVRIVATNSYPKTCMVSMKSMCCNTEAWDVGTVTKENPELGSGGDAGSEYTLKRGESVSFVCKVTRAATALAAAAAAGVGSEAKLSVLPLSDTMTVPDCANLMSSRFLERATAPSMACTVHWELTDLVGADGQKNPVVRGHSDLVVPLSSFDTTGSAGNAKSIEIGIKHPNEIVHDFDGSPLATIGLALVFQNCTDKAITAMIELLEHRASVVPAGQPAVVHPNQGHFSWIGKTKSRIGPIAPAEVVTLPLSLAVCGPGVYDVNRVAVVALSESGALSASLGHPSLITVRAAKAGSTKADA